MKRPIELFIGIPSGTEWKADFGMSLAGMVAAAGRPLKDGRRIERLQLWNTKGSILPRSRNTLIKQARELKCSHALLIDSDQTFPVWTPQVLLGHNKQVVAANIATKVLPASPTARLWNKEKVQGDLVYSDANMHGLQRVWRVGTGVMLIDLSIFDKLPQPWFPITWNEERQDYTGEDWNFCALLQENGIPIFIDHDLSRNVGHIGSFTYDHNVVGEIENGNASSDT